MYDTAAESQGKVFVSTELGGGGSASRETCAIALDGVRNFLAHAGILDWRPVLRETIMLDMPDDHCFVTALHTGLLEMLVDPGEPVVHGQPVARIHDVERCGAPPAEYGASTDGLLIGRHFPGLIQSGDMIASIAKPRR